MYTVECECGAVRSVLPTDAGSRLPCACGREIVVPSLSALKATAGQSAMSAEVRIEQMLQRGVLPRETNCLVCETPTTAVAHCWTTCERAVVQQPTDWQFSPWNVVSLVFGVLTFRKVEHERSEGRDLRFRLPLRVCPDCTDQLRDPRRMKETLLDVPAYAELLDKYPDADVSLDLGLAGIVRRDGM
jgi:hypothetical protein